MLKLEILLMQCRAELLTIELEAKGMGADNQRAIAEGCYPVFVLHHFQALGEKTECIVERLKGVHE